MPRRAVLFLLAPERLKNHPRRRPEAFAFWSDHYTPTVLPTLTNCHHLPLKQENPLDMLSIRMVQRSYLCREGNHCRARLCCPRSREDEIPGRPNFEFQDRKGQNISGEISHAHAPRLLENCRRRGLGSGRFSLGGFCGPSWPPFSQQHLLYGS